MCVRVSRWFQGRFHANGDIANGVWVSRIVCTQDTGVVMMREVCYQNYRSACVIRGARPVSWLISKSWFQGWSMAPGFKAGFMGGFKAVSASWFQGRFQGGFKVVSTLARFQAPPKTFLPYIYIYIYRQAQAQAA